jgi:hypothetical protein
MELVISYKFTFISGLQFVLFPLCFVSCSELVCEKCVLKAKNVQACYRIDLEWWNVLYLVL